MGARGVLVAAGIAVGLGFAGVSVALMTEPTPNRTGEANQQATQGTQLAQCTGTDPVRCAQDVLEDTVEGRGPKAALAALVQLRRRDEAVDAACHSLAHHIGQQASKSGGLVRELLSVDDGQCLWGYQHGVLEGWALMVDKTQLVEGLREACRAYPAGSGEWGSCSHGLGHAIAMQGPKNLLEAAGTCGQLRLEDRVGCFSGVVMAFGTGEASQGGAKAREPLRLGREEVETVCAAVDEAYRQTCSGSLWLLTQRVGMSVEAGVGLCLADWREVCEEGFGARVLYESSMQVEDALTRCSGSGFPTSCVLGVAWARANAWVGVDHGAAGFETLCDRVAPDLKRACSLREERALEAAR